MGGEVDSGEMQVTQMVRPMISSGQEPLSNSAPPSSQGTYGAASDDDKVRSRCIGVAKPPCQFAKKLLIVQTKPHSLNVLTADRHLYHSR